MEKVVFATQQYVDKSIEEISGGSSSFIKIASGSNIDLSIIATNDLTYESGITAANSIECFVIISRPNGTDVYDDNGGSAAYSYSADGDIIIGEGSLGIDALNATTKRTIVAISQRTIKTTGNKSINVTTGTGAQFLINVEIWGIKLS